MYIKKIFFCFFLISITFCSCNHGIDDILFLEVSQFEQFFKEYPEAIPYRENLKSFYEKRDFTCAWLNQNGLNEYAKKFIELLRIETSDSLYSAIFAKKFIDTDDIIIKKKYRFSSGDSVTAIYEFLLSSAFFDYARRSWYGMNDNNLKKAGWLIERKKFNYPLILDSLLNENANTFLTFQPVYKQYALLKSYYEKYRTIKNNGEWPTPYAGKVTLKKGDNNNILKEIKKELLLLKDLTDNDTSALFTGKLEQGIKKFQLRHGIDQDGMISEKTAHALTVSVRQRMKQLLVNMERCRWLPKQFTGDVLLINIPEYKLFVYKNDTRQWDCDVVVGTDSTSTVIFSDSMEYIIFSPYWGIPKSIVLKETIPSVIKDPGYLESHNMEVVDETGKIIDPSAILWRDYDENFPYSIRQKPGIDNSLGCVKFIFPNSHNIYLHDTPAKSLFGESDRAFSHGCVRVSEPLKLAQYLLRNDKKWTTESIKDAMYEGKETLVKLEPKIPVYIIYFTAWVDEKGNLHFRDDIYQHDEAMKKLLLL